MNTREIVVRYFLEKQGGECTQCGESLGERVALQFKEDPEWGGEKRLENVEVVHGQCTTRGAKQRRKGTALRLQKEGQEPREIARKLGVTLWTVYNYLRRPKKLPQSTEREIEPGDFSESRKRTAVWVDEDGSQLDEEF